MFIFSCGIGKEKRPTADKVQSNNSQTEETGVLAQLANSPRHQEWVNLQRPGRNLQAYVVDPESNSKTKSIIVIHDQRGLEDLARLFSATLAGAVYPVI